MSKGSRSKNTATFPFQNQNGKDFLMLHLQIIDLPNSTFTANREYDEFAVRHYERYCNDQLRARGHLMLNDVLNLFGLKRIKMGYRYGWLMISGKPLNNQLVEIKLGDIRPSHIELLIYSAGDIWDLL